jgi:DNA segregation ATPase FtsK/SpoIIIE-like protein
VTEHPAYRVPSTDLLNEVPPRNPFDSLELKEIAARIKSKFEEFNVHGAVVQINPGPVVTTFEFKPEAGVKYSRITTLTEDLCLGLQAESILIERIPGKPTVGIEVPNTRREVISLRQILESEEFRLQLAPDHLPGQGHQRPHQSGGAGIHASPADRRLHRRGQKRDAQFHDHVDPVQVHSRTKCA